MHGSYLNDRLPIVGDLWVGDDVKIHASIRYDFFKGLRTSHDL